MGSQLLLSQRWHFTKIKAFISSVTLVSESVSDSVTTCPSSHHPPNPNHKYRLNICLKQVLYTETHIQNSGQAVSQSYFTEDWKEASPKFLWCGNSKTQGRHPEVLIYVLCCTKVFPNSISPFWLLFLMLKIVDSFSADGCCFLLLE